MDQFAKFMTTNGLKRKDIASYLGVSGAFITQIKSGDRPLPSEKLALIQANKAWDSSMLTINASSASQKMIHGLDTSGLLRGMKITSAHVQDAVNKAAVRVVQPEGKIVQSYLEQKVKDLDAKIAAKDELINQLYEQIGMLKAELNLAKEGKV